MGNIVFPKRDSFDLNYCCKGKLRFRIKQSFRKSSFKIDDKIETDSASSVSLVRILFNYWEVSLRLNRETVSSLPDVVPPSAPTTAV